MGHLHALAGFIGSPSMNLLDATLRHSERGATAEIGGFQLPLGALDGVADGHPIVVGVRPEHLAPADTGISGQVSVVEPTGAETYLVVRAGSQDLVAVLRERQDFRPGQAVSLAARDGMVHVFDQATGARLS